MGPGPLRSEPFVAYLPLSYAHIPSSPLRGGIRRRRRSRRFGTGGPRRCVPPELGEVGQTAPAGQAAATASAPVTLPTRLTDAEFWKLSNDFSEPNGYFRSDNLLSNEIWFQYLVPELQTYLGKGGVYLGVGPEQNFTYIAALEPRMVIIFDIRRGNMHTHLMYKALFELSTNRAEFVSMLFSRQKPAELTKDSTVQQIFTAVAAAPTSQERYKENLKRITDHLTKTRGLPLPPEDLAGIDYVYSNFHYFGPGINYNSSSSGGGGRGAMSTYASLMTATDGAGVSRSYLANDALFTVMQDLHKKNLLVPVVGDFAGPKAIRSVGKYLKARERDGDGVLPLERGAVPQPEPGLADLL